MDKDGLETVSVEMGVDGSLFREGFSLLEEVDHFKAGATGDWSRNWRREGCVSWARLGASSATSTMIIGV